MKNWMRHLLIMALVLVLAISTTPILTLAEFVIRPMVGWNT